MQFSITEQDSSLHKDYRGHETDLMALMH